MGTARLNATWEFWIDVGGTFTDCVALRPDGSLRTHKLLSSGVYKGRVTEGSTPTAIVDPLRRADPPEFFRGWRLALLRGDGRVARSGETRPCGESERRDDICVCAFDAAAGRIELARPAASEPGMSYELRCDEPAPVVGIRWLLGKRLDEPIGPVRVRLGTTRGTNALLERQGAATAFVTTAGFADLLLIGDQTRPRLFELNIRKPPPLYREVVELDERMDARGRVLRPLDEAGARQKLERLRVAGVQTLAICLLNSYRNPAHEERIAAMAREFGFEHVSISSELSPLQRILPRAQTTVIDAYLAPVIAGYVRELRARLPGADIRLMTSAGSLVDATAFVAKDSILSGPAAGVVGAAHVAKAAGFERAIGFDMGGTSTDVSRYDGQLERRYEMEIEDRATRGSTRIVGQMLAIETVAAGGGSICDFDGIKPIVGPRSAGADPGPACYGRGGPLCLTDVNLYLGRITQELFPFPLDRAAVEQRLRQSIEQIKHATGRRYDPLELAAGYVAIANAHMAAAIRKVSIRRGYDPREYVLVSFGGAGGQHACAIARELGMPSILFHPLAGVLSAYGIGMAGIVRFASRDVGRTLSDAALDELRSLFEELEARLRREVEAEGVPRERIAPARRLLELRYTGQDATLTVPEPPDGHWRREFERLHQQLYGFTYPGREIEVFAARLEVHGVPPSLPRPERPEHTSVAGPARSAPSPHCFADVYCNGGLRRTPVYLRDELRRGERFEGPALVLETTGTIVVEPGWSAEATERGDIVLTDALKRPSPPSGRASARTTAATSHGRRKRAAHAHVAATAPSDRPDPITLELFNHHFAAVAEQMGATLQRTALSTNVKERLDFSCAVYDAGGELVAHAPHIPVHIGAMGACVKHLIRETQAGGALGPLRPGEVYVTNDPYRGGSHLPDVTVITPVFDERGQRGLFFVANRAHHAEIGGIAPGSMPPASRNLAEEGVLIRLMRLVTKGGGDATDSREARSFSIGDDELRRILATAPYPSRAVDTNLADIHAQIAANQRGVLLLREMVTRWGLQPVQAYMRHIRDAAETKMRAALGRLRPGEYRFTDYLDDGAPIAVRITVADGRVLATGGPRGLKPAARSATIDFTGTGPVLASNLNATPAIVASAVLYCFRCLMDEDIPLNAGVLAPLRIVLPESCLLNPPAADDPRDCPAVAGGNVETSQRIVDCIFGALRVVAASQGTMNNLAFGQERFGYYETIGGGAGAGPHFDGADAVHTHMTNTRLTDAEVLEDRYPVRLRRFATRRGSGGRGAHRGGDGIVREIEFLEALNVSLLTQRRTRRPYGLAGGEPGAAGRNLLVPASSSGGGVIELPSLGQFAVRPGDVLVIETPGGGGCGAV